MLYPLKQPFVLNFAAKSRFADPSITEIRRAEALSSCMRGHYRCIGGNQGDLLFDGYSVGKGRTTLANATLWSNLDLSDDEAMEIARAVFDEAFASVGEEIIE